MTEASSTALAWWAILKALFKKVRRDKTSILAAGVAFFGLLAIFPALSALVSLIGFLVDPGVVREQLEDLQGAVPSEAIRLLSKWLDTLLNRSRSAFGLSLLISVMVSVWIARSATGSMIAALNVAYEEAEARSFILYNLVALSLTAMLILLGILVLLLVAALPIAIGLLQAPASIASFLSLLRWPALALLIAITIAALYRFGPNRPHSRWEWASTGAVLATLLWIMGSIGLSIYVSRFADYDQTYGSIGAVVVLLLWLWMGAYAVLAGAALNSILAQRSNGNTSRNAGASET